MKYEPEIFMLYETVNKISRDKTVKLLTNEHENELDWKL